MLQHLGTGVPFIINWAQHALPHLRLPNVLTNPPPFHVNWGHFHHHHHIPRPPVWNRRPPVPGTYCTPNGQVCTG